MSGHFHVWSYDKYVMSGFTHKSFFAYVRTAKAQTSLRICTVSPEPSLFTWWIYGPRGRFRQRIEHLAPFSFCTCAFMWSLHADMLRTFYAWWRSNNVIHWISTTSYEKFKYSIKLSWKFSGQMRYCIFSSIFHLTTMFSRHLLQGPSIYVVEC